MAFARAFGVPIGWFFMPPPLWSDRPGVPVKLSTPDAEAFGTALAELVDLVLGDEDAQALLATRLEGWLQQNPPELTDAQRQITRLVRHRVESLASHTIKDLTEWQIGLRGLANHLEDLEVRSRRAVSEDPDIENF